MKKGILIVLDGYGEGKPSEFNAVANANTPTLKKLKTLSHSLLKTHGEAVGLFENEMGGSEVGHTTIGAGRIVKSTAKRIRDEILSGDFQKNKTLTAILNGLKKNNADLHLFGLMSDKNIHSNIEHCLEIITLAKDKAKNIYIHFVTDGRDSGVYDSIKYLKLLKNHIKNIENCQILSISGRFYAMDRENHEERINKAYSAMFGQDQTIDDVEEYIKSQHEKGNNDQYVEPASVKSSTFKGVNKNDCILFFNFREDRLRQIVKKCEELKCNLITMADVGGVNAKSIYPSEITKNTLSEYLSKNGLSQIKVSETTKYAHVTYFFNGGKEEAFKNEERIHIPTKKTTDYSKTPTMRAKEITKQTNIAIKKGYDAIIVNYSNADMIGHTGDYNAVVKSLECLDKCVNKVLKTAKKHGYFVLVTADHGNSEEMQNKNGEPNTAHTINRVMCVVADGEHKMKRYGELSDVAPTFVELLGLKPSKHFEGNSLLIK